MAQVNYEQGNEVLKNLTSGERVYLGTLEKGVDLLASEPTTELVTKALVEKGLVIENANASDEDPDFVNGQFYEENEKPFSPFPISIGKDGEVTMYRGFDLWDYDSIAFLEIVLSEQDGYKVYLAGYTNMAG